MNEEIIMFGDIKIEKHNFRLYKSPIFLVDVDIEIFSSDLDKTKIVIKVIKIKSR